MKFTYQGRKYEFNERKLHTSEAIAVKQHTGMTVRAFYAGLGEVDVDSFRCLVLLGLRRAGEPIKWDDIEFDLFEFAEGLERPDEEAAPPTSPTGTTQWPEDESISAPSPS